MYTVYSLLLLNYILAGGIFVFTLCFDPFQMFRLSVCFVVSAIAVKQIAPSAHKEIPIQSILKCFSASNQSF